MLLSPAQKLEAKAKTIGKLESPPLINTTSEVETHNSSVETSRPSAAKSNTLSLTAFLLQHNKETAEARRTSSHLAGISFTGPEEMVITPDGLGTAAPKLGVPLDPKNVRRLGLFLRYEPILKDCALRGWLDVYPSNSKSAKFLKEHSLPLAITKQDIRAALDHVVTKVVYLSESATDNPTSYSTQTMTLAESDLSAPVPEGNNSILLVLRIAGTFNSSDNPSMDLPPVAQAEEASVTP